MSGSGGAAGDAAPDGGRATGAGGSPYAGAGGSASRGTLDAGTAESGGAESTGAGGSPYIGAGGAPSSSAGGAGTADAGVAETGGAASTGAGGVSSGVDGSAPGPGEVCVFDHDYSYAFGGVTSGGKIVAAYWTGSVEAVVLLDGDTCASTRVGDLGDMTGLDSLIFDPETRMVYAFGQTANDVLHLYTLSFGTGMTTSSPALSRRYIAGGPTADGKVIGVYSSTPFVAALLDPVTGEESPVGTFGDMQGLNAMISYDRQQQVAYVVGVDGTFSWRLYWISLVTGLSASDPLTGDQLSNDCRVGPVLSDGGLLLAHLSGSRERLERMDPSTGQRSVLGDFGTLAWWSSQYVLDGARGIVYADGFDQSGIQHLYRLSL